MTVYFPGEVWQDSDGRPWFVVTPLGDVVGSHMRDENDVLLAADYVVARYGPLSLVYQPTTSTEAGDQL